MFLNLFESFELYFTVFAIIVNKMHVFELIILEFELFVTEFAANFGNMKPHQMTIHFIFRFEFFVTFWAIMKLVYIKMVSSNMPLQASF